MAKKVTLSAIAEACGTSVGTVSRALNEKSDINSETKAQILKTAAMMGYRKERAGSVSGPMRIGIVYCKNHPSFYDAVTHGIEDAQRDLRSAGVQVIPMQTEYLEQNEQIELLNKLDPTSFDGILINSAGRETGDWIDSCIAGGTPVATFNTDAPTSRRLFFVGVNSYNAGCVGGELLAKFMNGHGKVAVFGNFAGNAGWIDRFTGFCAVIQRDYLQIDLVPVLQYYGNDEIAFKEILSLLQRQPDISALFPSNFSCTVGTVRALRELGRKDIMVVGFDLAPETRDGLRDGYCDAILYQNPYRQGYQSIKCMAQYLAEGVLPPTSAVSIPTSILLRYNMDVGDLRAVPGPSALC